MGWKWGPEQTGRAPVESMTRKGKGSADKKQGKGTENEKGGRVEGYRGHCGNGGTDKGFVCLSRQVYRAETDTAELQDVDPKSKQTTVPVAALRRNSTRGLPDEQRNDGRIRTIPSQSAYHAQHEFEDRTSFEDNDAVEHECSPHCCSGMPTRSASRVVSRVSLRTEIGETVKIDSRRSVSGTPKRGIQAIFCHRHKYTQKYSTQQLFGVATPCMDDHQFKEEENESVGELSTVCSQKFLKCLYLLRIGRPDILWSVNKLARALPKWTKSSDKRLARLISYIHHASEHRQHC